MIPNSPLLLPLLVGAALATATIAQSHSVGAYDSESFEATRIQLGTLPGTGFANGQDGWLLIDSLAYPGNLAAASVQTAIVRSGTQAVRWNAALMTPGSDGELRRNAQFSLTTGVIEAELDFLITASSQPSSAWGCYTQPYPHPQTAQLWWEVRSSGEIWYCTNSNRTWFGTGAFVGRNVWHHADPHHRRPTAVPRPDPGRRLRRALGGNCRLRPRRTGTDHEHPCRRPI